MDRRDAETTPHFSQPVRQISLMLIALAVVGAGAYLGIRTLSAVFFTNVYLNTAIAAVFALGVLSCFRQVVLLMRSVSWIEGFAHNAPGWDQRAPPSLLAPLAALLRTRGARMQLTSTSTRTILDSVATRVDEDQEITRYLSNVLIFLGLLGTFYGLATTVPALVDTIRSLSPQEGETGADIFGRLQTGLESQLGGMGTAFSSSLLGLAGSLIVGLLELFAGHGQGRFYREMEEWLSSMTRVGLSGEDGVTESSVFGQVVDTMAEQMEALQLMFQQSDAARAQTDRRLGEIAVALGQLAQRIEERDSAPALLRIAEGQEQMVAALDRMGALMAEGGADAESRMRLRSIDVQVLRILEELSAGRQETLAELRADLTNLARSLRGPARLRDEMR
ncbi:biopolymer transporter ExbB [Rubellimicrobium roseum]|uniref:Biopolymer transporter ExbB n=1 Tax=Rubellimicrobium roseum TaxID=687525 RepID=A0A5C4NQM7_9RHOB|nr:biopolymer transporter ExbB [Rubellimicrobium roseum]TNC74699.1 biopolymer transporter ExbB [Rubellimicrobium roseum]